MGSAAPAVVEGKGRVAGEDGNTHWDAFVVGSDMGGLTAAAALARTGNRVLILEQYENLGGLTHSFSRDGFPRKVGLHYPSDFASGSQMHDMPGWLMKTPIEFASMGAVYDNVHIGSAEPLALSRSFEAQEMDLKDRFPDKARRSRPGPSRSERDGTRS